jgi:predicted RNA-binding Zn-ribbon protein involved in translation (DUF1610 family)
MTTRNDIRNAAFWEHEFCIACGATVEPDEGTSYVKESCPECDALCTVVKAAHLERFLDRIEADEQF